MVEGALGRGRTDRARAERGRIPRCPRFPIFFSRADVGIVIGEHAIIGSMRHGVRWTEELLIKALFRYDQKVRENAGILYDGSDEKRNQLHARRWGTCIRSAPDLLVLGFRRALEARRRSICSATLVFANCNVTDVIIVVPARRAHRDPSRQ